MTALEFGSVRRSTAGGDPFTDRLHAPGWEVIPILVAPVVLVALLWLVVPWIRSVALGRRQRDLLVPRW